MVLSKQSWNHFVTGNLQIFLNKLTLKKIRSHYISRNISGGNINPNLLKVGKNTYVRPHFTLNFSFPVRNMSHEKPCAASRMGQSQPLKMHYSIKARKVMAKMIKLNFLRTLKIK